MGLYHFFKDFAGPIATGLAAVASVRSARQPLADAPSYLRGLPTNFPFWWTV
jgi:hypothetical protein